MAVQQVANQKAGFLSGFFVFLRRSPWVWLLPLAFLAYHNLLNAGFVGDDYDQIAHNATLQNASGPGQLFTSSTFYAGGSSSMRGTYYKPLMSFTFWVLYKLFGAAPGPFHLALVIIKAINAILAYLFFRHSFSEKISFLGAAIFLLHPLNSEVVAYLSDFQDALFLFFGLLALVMATRTPRPTWTKAAVMGIFLLLSMLAKETGVLMGVLLLIYYGRPKVPLTVSILVSYAIYFLLRISVAGLTTLQAHYTPMELADWTTRLLNIPAVVAYYIVGFFWPWPLSLSQHWMIYEFSWRGFVLPLIEITLALAFGIWTLRRFGTKARIFLACAVVGIGLHSQILPLDATVADRWFYLPSLGFIGLWLFWASHSRVILYGSLLGLGAFFIVSFQRAELWQNEEKLLARDLTYQPESFSLMNQLGYLYFAKGQDDKACPLFEKSVALAPKWWVNVNNLGACRFRQGQMDQAKALFQAAIHNGQYHMAYENYVRVLIAEQDWADARSALDQIQPHFPGNLVFPALRQFIETHSSGNAKH